MRKWSTMKKLIWLRGSPLGVTPEYTTVGPTSLATFTAVRSAPLKSLVVTMEPVQSGSGDPSPDNVRPISGYTEVNVWRTGRNLFPVDIDIDDSLYTHSYSLSSYPAIADFFAALNILRGQKVIASCAKTGTASGSSIGQVRVMYGSTTLVAFNPNEAKVVPDVDYSTATSVIIYGSTTGATVTDVMLEAGETVHDFVPYTGTTVTISLGGTRYGGTLDVVTGVMTVTHKEITVASAARKVYNADRHLLGLVFPSGAMADASSQRNAITSMYPVRDPIVDKAAKLWRSEIDVMDESFSDQASAEAALADFVCVYKLATPFTVQLDPEEVQTLVGENNVWSDAGDVTVTYRSN